MIFFIQPVSHIKYGEYFNFSAKLFYYPPELNNPNVNNNANNPIIYPNKNNIFECFKYFELNETKVVLLGQDPYINKNEAMGLSFSVPKSNKKIPPSLKNIYKELNISRDHGDLTHWVNESQFLLLNTSLTVFEGKSNSHTAIWRNYTNKISNYK